jgi:hypothetical protein
MQREHTFHAGIGRGLSLITFISRTATPCLTATAIQHTVRVERIRVILLLFFAVLSVIIIVIKVASHGVDGPRPLSAHIGNGQMDALGALIYNALKKNIKYAHKHDKNTDN